VSFDDLKALARLCLRQAAATASPVTAAVLKRMAGEYQARADVLDDAAAPPQQTALQQQQPQPESSGGGKDEKRYSEGEPH
jgi:hypothetical protein